MQIKKIIIGVTFLAVLSLTACGSTSDGTTTQETVEVESTQEQEQTTESDDSAVEKLTAMDVLTYLQGECSSIGEYIEYTEETDTNELLGRPNQYTSKINGEDTRVEQSEDSDPKGFSIEVFENNEDAVSRQEYINSIGEEVPLLVEYNYVNDYILLRVDKSLTPSEAQEYEDALNKIFD